MRGRSGLFPEILVFPTRFLVSGLKFLSFDHFSPVTGINSTVLDGLVLHCLLYFNNLIVIIIYQFI